MNPHNSSAVVLPGRDILPFYNQANKYPTLDANAEREFLRRCKQGDNDAFQMLVLYNLDWALKVARYYLAHLSAYDTHHPPEEIIQECYLALIKAINGYDISSEVRLATYARPVLDTHFQDYMSTFNRDFRVTPAYRAIWRTAYQHKIFDVPRLTALRFAQLNEMKLSEVELCSICSYIKAQLNLTTISKNRKNAILSKVSRGRNEGKDWWEILNLLQLGRELNSLERSYFYSYYEALDSLEQLGISTKILSLNKIWQDVTEALQITPITKAYEGLEETVAVTLDSNTNVDEEEGIDYWAQVQRILAHIEDGYKIVYMRVGLDIDFELIAEELQLPLKRVIAMHSVCMQILKTKFEV